jgi:hypothetical protein
VSHLTVRMRLPESRVGEQVRFRAKGFRRFFRLPLAIQFSHQLGLMTASSQVIASIELVGSAPIINTVLNRSNFVSRTNR